MEASHLEVPDAVRDALGWIGGGLLAVSLLPQIVQLVRTQSAADLSFLFGTIYLLGNALTVVYMVLVGALAAWIPVVIEIVLCIITLTLKVVYDHTDWGRRQQQQQQQLQELQLQLADASRSAFSQAARAGSGLLQRQPNYLGLYQDHYSFTGAPQLADPSGQIHGLNDSAINYIVDGKLLHVLNRYSAHGLHWSAASSCGTGNSESAASTPTVKVIPASLWQPTSAAEICHHSAGQFFPQAAAAGLVAAGMNKSKLPWYCQSGISHVRSVTPRHAVHVCHNCGTLRLARAAVRFSAPGGTAVQFSAPGSAAVRFSAPGSTAVRFSAPGSTAVRCSAPGSTAVQFSAPGSSATATLGSVIISDMISGNQVTAGHGGMSNLASAAPTTATLEDNRVTAAAPVAPPAFTETGDTSNQHVGAASSTSLPLSASQSPNRRAPSDADSGPAGTVTVHGSTCSGPAALLLQAPAASEAQVGPSRLSRVIHRDFDPEG